MRLGRPGLLLLLHSCFHFFFSRTSTTCFQFPYLSPNDKQAVLLFYFISCIAFDDFNQPKIAPIKGSSSPLLLGDRFLETVCAFTTSHNTSQNRPSITRNWPSWLIPSPNSSLNPPSTHVIFQIPNLNLIPNQTSFSNNQHNNMAETYQTSPPTPNLMQLHLLSDQTSKMKENMTITIAKSGP